MKFVTIHFEDQNVTITFKSNGDKCTSKSIQFDVNGDSKRLSSRGLNTKKLDSSCDKKSIICKDINCTQCFNKSFASHFKSKYLSYKNKINPRYISKRSTKKLVFNCDCGHEFKGTLSAVSAERWCGYCSNPPKLLCSDQECKQCFDKSFASYEKSKYWSSKNNIDPRYVFKFSNNLFLFDCDCGHEFISCPNAISTNKWCSYCNNKKLCSNQECKQCFDKSFASHEKSKYWSSKNNIDPRYVFLNSNKSYIFNCDCGHEFKSTLSAVSAERWCGYCSNPPKLLCSDQECKQCFEKSFASHEKSKYWSSKNNIDSRQVFFYSNKVYWFKCIVCNHEFQTQISDVSCKNNWCSFCGNKRLCSDQECKQCFEKSFASHEKSKYWSTKNNLVPRQVFKHTGRKYLFDCFRCNSEFLMGVGYITKGQYCTKCKKKTEFKLFQYLNEIYHVEREVKFDWCIFDSKYSAKFDFFLKNFNIVIELDGDQHFKQISKWKSCERTRKNDVFKMNKCLQNGISMIRLLQSDVYTDKNDWKTKLLNSIKEYDSPTIIYLNDTIYSNHIKDMN